MLISAFRAIINKLYEESFNTIFIENIKNWPKINHFIIFL